MKNVILVFSILFLWSVNAGDGAATGGGGGKITAKASVAIEANDLQQAINQKVKNRFRPVIEKKLPVTSIFQLFNQLDEVTLRDGTVIKRDELLDHEISN